MWINIKFKDKRIKLGVRSTNLFTRFSGLMFKTKNTDNLIFNFNYYAKWSIHSLFVFFPFLALWLDEQNNVLDFKIVKPFCLSIIPNKKFKKLIEIPVNEKNEKIIKIFLKKS